VQQGFGLNKDTQVGNSASAYNQIKEFLGKKYTGMKVGGRHLWYYDKGEWKEKKVAPDKWEFTYNVKKRRAWDAPEGSGVPIGTQYHWYILADQTVSKLDANVYSTSMSGLKYKLSHKRAHSQNWNATEDAQSKHVIKILEELITTLKQQTKMEFKQVTLDNLLDTIQY
jgi:hypothetical protein